MHQIVKYDLDHESVQETLDLEYALFTGSQNYLYTTEHNYLDLAVDENGMWVTYTSSQQPTAMQVCILLYVDV